MTTSTVTVSGLTWTVHSANERSVTHQGRHFFAARCGGLQWTITEVSDGTTTGSTVVRTFTNKYDTSELSRSIKEITAGTAEHPAVDGWIPRSMRM